MSIRKLGSPLVSVVIQSYNSRRYIERCLDTLLGQDYTNLEVLIIINGASDDSDELIRARAKRSKKIRIIEPGENTFYSRGNNIGIRQSQGQYVFALNQDTVMEPSFIRKLVAALEQDATLGAVSGKLLHYNFSVDSKTKILDSTGIEIFKTRRVIDRGQWERDYGQYDQDTEIFGASGAAAMYRKSALEEIKIPKANGVDEYFDEDFGAYKEDIDLAWRLQLAGYSCRYIPEAVIYHGRSVGRSWPNQLVRFIVNRHKQSRFVRKLAFKNHYLMMVKNETRELFLRHFIYIFVREALLLAYTAIFEPFQIFALIEFFRQLPFARRKRQLIMRNLKADPAHLRKLFH